MKSIFIYHHLGLGDHIICNGLVRELTILEDAEIVYLPVKYHNLNSVLAMYSDDSRIKCIPVSGDLQVASLPQLKKGLCDSVYRVGHEKTRVDWDVSFYDSVGIPFEKRWTSFKCNRDYTRETILSSIVNPTNEEFILVHDTCSIGTLAFNLKTNTKIIRVNPVTCYGWSSVLTDWCGLIDKAKEVHCIDSSFIHLCASMGRNGVFHDFHRGNPFVLPKSWETIKEN